MFLLISVDGWVAVDAITGNVSLLELVAAYGNYFFHNRPSEVMKSKRTIYRKTSHEI
jgi:hypothetical protein